MYPDVNDIFISFFGGEPLLEKDILYIRTTQENCYRKAQKFLL